MKKLTAKDFRPGQRTNFSGDYQVDASIVIPKGLPVRITGTFTIHFRGAGTKPGMGGLCVFQIPTGAYLVVDPVASFDIGPKNSVFRLAGGSVDAAKVKQNNGTLAWIQGADEVLLYDCESTGRPDKYYVLTASARCKRLLIDFSHTNKTINGGKNEAVIRTMQCDSLTMRGGKWRGVTKQTVQLISGKDALVEEIDTDSMIVGWIKDKTIKNVAPLRSVTINRSKIGSLQWNAKDWGKVVRDGKRIR